MSPQKKASFGCGIISFGTAGALLLVGAKLFGFVSLPWAWVLLPFWGPALALAVAATTYFGVIAVHRAVRK